MRVLFLDVDGVLNRMAVFAQVGTGQNIMLEGREVFIPLVPELVSRLNRLLGETGAKVVVSSNWRTIFPFHVLTEVLRKCGVVGEVVDRTGHTIGQVSRDREIADWLRAHVDEVESFAIVDDNAINWGAPPLALESRLVQTSSDDGLQDRNVEALRLLLLQNMTRLDVEDSLKETWPPRFGNKIGRNG